MHNTAVIDGLITEQTSRYDYEYFLWRTTSCEFLINRRHKQAWIKFFDLSVNQAVEFFTQNRYLASRWKVVVKVYKPVLNASKFSIFYNLYSVTGIKRNTLSNR